MYIDYKEQINNPFFSLPLVLGDTLRALTCSFQSGSQSTLPGQHSKLTVVEQAIFKIFVPIWGGAGDPQVYVLCICKCPQRPEVGESVIVSYLI